jgi:exopolysaccharide biosynthesis polyprenyl glycosylphosphotransferase
MFKQQARKIAIVQRIVDMTTVFLTWLLSYYIRFKIIPGGDTGLFYKFLGISVILIPIYFIFYTRNNLYHSKRYYSWYKEVYALTRANFEAFAVFFVILYFTSSVRMSRLTFLIFGVLVILFSVSQRLIIRRQLFKLRKDGKNLRHIVLIGYGQRLEEYIRTLKYLPEAGIKINGWIDSRGSAREYSISEMEFTELEGTKQDMVVVGYPSREYEKLNEMINLLNQKYIPLMMIPNIQYDYLGVAIEEFEGIPLIEINPPRTNPVGHLLKRTMDIVGSLVGIIILSPLYFIIAVAVKLTSRGPIFYGQERMSLDGKTFKMWKFRSMKVDAEEKSGAVWAKKSDDRRTAIGGFLRKTSLDEIPQFWNVLKGDMSLVGPRPERPVFIDQFKDQIPAYMLRHRVKAGITGWAQINGWRGDTSIEKRIEFDIFYIKNWSLWFDIRILLLTFIKGFINENAY